MSSCFSTLLRAGSTLGVLLGLSSLPAAAQTTRPDAVTIFPKGERAPAWHFTGTVWVNSLVPDDSTYHCVVGSVRFEAGARTHWHRHPSGQILLVTDGVGYYQERGQPRRLVRKGDVIKAPPGVEHWHGALPGQAMTHVALVPNTGQGAAVWLQPVTEQQYRGSN